MDVRMILSKVRQRQTLDADELAWFAQGLADQSISDAQAGAFAMGICMGSLGKSGRAALTLAMRDSGRTLEWALDGPVLDKHSTGGVGDCVSLILAPALAACGAYVPMISGRGLGHTGGTLDKLDAIPGLSTELDAGQFHDVVRQTGCAIVSATADIAPADRRLYAVRDVTSTVESLDLITASILSKKLAAGLQGLVLDVKIGSGAFMKDIASARALGQALTDTANAAGCPTTALITDMHQPVVPSLGNALEVAEVMQVLTGADGSEPIVELCAALGGPLMAGAKLSPTQDMGSAALRKAIVSGKAAEVFGKMIAAMGGPVQFVENWQRFLPEATVIREAKSTEAGYVTAIDGEALGLAVVALGGGRQVEGDQIDPSVGLSDVVRLGAKIEAGQPLARVHAARESAADGAVAALRAAIEVGPRPTRTPSLIHERIT
jgi:thymidine phosphorylase